LNDFNVELHIKSHLKKLPSEKQAY